MKHMKLVTMTLALLCALSLAGVEVLTQGRRPKTNHLLTVKTKISLAVGTQMYPMTPPPIWTT